jgi:G3E family GTPase
VNAPEQIDRRGEMTKQIAAADRILITKTDLVSRGAAARLSRRLAALNPAAEIRDVHDRTWDTAWLIHEEPGAVRHRHAVNLDARADPAALAEEDGHGSIKSFSITLDRPIDWTAFGIWLTMLLNRHGPQVLRVKGILDLVGEERPVAVHGVQRLVHPPTHMSSWPTEDRRSHIVFIVDGLDPARIIDSLAAFTMQETEAA